MRLILFLTAGFLSLFCAAQDFSAYENHYYNALELNLPYRLLRPPAADTAAKYPLIVFLHGAYEKGFDNEAQLSIGGRYFLRDSIRKNYPAYVLFPQCPAADVWANFETQTEGPAGRTTELKFPFDKKPTDVSYVLLKLIDSLRRVDKIDPARIYIGGLSQGGMGVLDLIARYPNVFAAGFSMCGAGNTGTAKYFAGKVSLWLFHGDKDDVIPLSFSRDYYKKLQKLNADVRYSEYPDIMHNCWTKAFAEPDLMRWLMSKQKK